MRWRDAGDVTTIRVLGEWDLANAPELRRVALVALGDAQAVVVDVSTAAFIDSAVISVLLQLRDLALRDRKAIVIQLGTEAVVRRVLEITGVLAVLMTVGSEEEAARVMDGRR